MMRSLRMLAGAMLLTLLVGCVSPPPPPTMEEVLDGSAFAAQREAAAAKADAIAEAIVGRSDPAATAIVKSTWCSEGQNNVKVHDGFRLRCKAGRITFVAWDGNFMARRAKFLDALPSECSAWSSGPLNPVPTPAARFLNGPSASCGPDVNVGTAWVAPGVIDARDGSFTFGCTKADTRCQQIESPEVIFARVSKHQWFVWLNVAVTFYTEVVA